MNKAGTARSREPRSVVVDVIVSRSRALVVLVAADGTNCFYSSSDITYR